MRKNIFEQTTGFNPVLRCYEDIEYFFRLANTFLVMYMAEKLFAYRKYEKQSDYLRMRGLVDNWSVVNALLVMLCRDDPSKQRVEPAVRIDLFRSRPALAAGWKTGKGASLLSTELCPASVLREEPAASGAYLSAGVVDFRCNRLPCCTLSAICCS